MPNKTTALHTARGCPGCAKTSDLPRVHLCSLPKKDGILRVISHEESMAVSQILPLLTPSPTLPLFLQGEVLLHSLLLFPVPVKRSA